MFLKVGVLKNFAIFTEKNLRWSLYLINLQAWSPVIEWFHKVARFIKRSKKSIVSIEFGRLFLFTIFTSRKSFEITCSISRSGWQGRNHSITSIYPVPVGKIYIEKRDKNHFVSFLSHLGPHINSSEQAHLRLLSYFFHCKTYKLITVMNFINL